MKIINIKIKINFTVQKNKDGAINERSQWQKGNRFVFCLSFQLPRGQWLIQRLGLTGS